MKEVGLQAHQASPPIAKDTFLFLSASPLHPLLLLQWTGLTKQNKASYYGITHITPLPPPPRPLVLSITDPLIIEATDQQRDAGERWRICSLVFALIFFFIFSAPSLFTPI